MKKILLAIVIVIVAASWSNLIFSTSESKPSENGLPFYNHYDLKNTTADQVHTMTIDSAGYLWLNSQLGILRFDGENYDFVKTQGLPFKIFTSSTGNIYLICNNSFGKIDKKTSSFSYTTIAKFPPQKQNFCQITENDGKIYFHLSNYFAIYDETTKTTDFNEVDDLSDFDIFFNYNKDIYVYKIHNGFYAMSDSNLFIPFDKPIDFNLEISDDSLLFVTDNNEFYILHNNEAEQLPDSIFKYFKGKILNGLQKFGNYQIIYTLNGGLVVFDAHNLKIIQIYNIYSGLADNQIYAMTENNNQELWFVNNLGLYRFDFNLSVNNFSDYVGLDGQIIATEMFDSVLYVLTSNGVYYLDRPQNINEYKFVEKKQTIIASRPTVQVVKTNNRPFNNNKTDTLKISQKKQTEKQDKEGFIKRWTKKIFGKKKNKVSESTPTNETENDTVEIKQTIDVDTSKTVASPPRTKIIVTYQKVKVDQNEDYKFYKIYKKIKNIDAKCSADEIMNGKMYIATDRGLFSIDKKHNVEKIIEDDFITTLYKNRDTLIVAALSGIYKIDKNGDVSFLTQIDNFNSYVFSITYANGMYWFGTNGYVYSTSDFSDFNTFAIDPDYLSKINLITINDKVFAYAPHCIYKYYEGLKRFEIYIKFNPDKLAENLFIKSQSNYVWYRINNKWHFQQNTSYSPDSTIISLLYLFDDVVNVKVSEDSNLWVVTAKNKIYKISKKNGLLEHPFKITLENVEINGNIYTSNIIKTSYSENLTADITIASNFYLDEGKTKILYSYSLKDIQDHKWNAGSKIINLPLNIGTQYIYVKAVNVLKQESNIIKIQITVKPPFWQTAWFKLILVITLFAIGFLLLYIRQKALKRRNEQLEKIVEQRTHELKQKNIELQAKQEEITRQNELLKEQRDEIKQTHEYIKQSINYARRIQQAIFPSEKILFSFFSDYFILNLPKDVVSGDFYWFRKTDDKLFIAVADCTGHGVPGAFLSMLGTAYLNEMINFRSDETAASSLNLLRKTIIYSLQEKEDNDIRDGMDMALCIIDKKENKLNFAGAYQNLFFIRDKKLTVIKGDRMPVAYSWKNDIPFTDKFIDIQKDDVIYLFTDGYADQFGGKNYEKLQTSRFREILIKIYDLPMQLQKEILLESHMSWRGDNKQIDDITVVGLKI